MLRCYKHHLVITKWHVVVIKDYLDHKNRQENQPGGVVWSGMAWLTSEGTLEHFYELWKTTTRLLIIKTLI